MQVLILGCGYVGTAFGKRRLSQGDNVQGTCRSEATADRLSDQGISPLIFDGIASTQLCEAARRSDLILASIPPTDDGDASFKPGIARRADVMDGLFVYDGDLW